LERIIQGPGLMNLINRVDQLQNEIQRLNGENENLRHELKQMQERNRQMYIDLDERLQNAQPTTAPTPTDAPVPLTGNPAETPTQQPVVTQGPTSGAEQVPTTEQPTPVAVESGEAAYQSALQTLRSGQYKQAAEALAKFPEEYPGSVYLPNAYYWQGEAKYVLREFDQAAALFQIVIDQYPESSKVADATLKRGFSEQELGDIERAKQSLQSVIDLYPQSSAARLAKSRLERM
jgi:tol-pal system protein YbgF